MVVLLLLRHWQVVTCRAPFAEMASFPVWKDANSIKNVEKVKELFLAIHFIFLRLSLLRQTFPLIRKQNVYILQVELLYSQVNCHWNRKCRFVPLWFCVYKPYAVY